MSLTSRELLQYITEHSDLISEESDIILGSAPVDRHSIIKSRSNVILNTVNTDDKRISNKRTSTTNAVHSNITQPPEEEATKTGSTKILFSNRKSEFNLIILFDR